MFQINVYICIMSTFGKRALIEWNYDEDYEQVKRYNKTSKDLQLEILEKWYPIGMICGLRITMGPKFVNTSDIEYNFIITEYYESLIHWKVKIKTILVDRYGNPQKYTNTKHPLRLIPEPNFETQLRRQYKLDNLL
jgi:hypothetical protein